MQIQQQVVSHMDYNSLGKLSCAKNAYYGNFHNSTDSGKMLLLKSKKNYKKIGKILKS